MECSATNNNAYARSLNLNSLSGVIGVCMEAGKAGQNLIRDQIAAFENLWCCVVQKKLLFVYVKERCCSVRFRIALLVGGCIILLYSSVVFLA